MNRRILLIRLSAIGDVVFASPLISAFRRRYPQSHLAWLVAEPCADLLTADTELDEVIVLPIAQWKRLARDRRYLRLITSVKAFRRQLRAKNFDLVVDLQGLLKSGVWAWLSGAPERIGLGSREGTQYLMTKRIDRRGGRRERIGSEYLYLAEQLGLDVRDFSMRVAVSSENRRQAESLAAEVVGQSGFGVICPFTTRPQKHWFVDRWEVLTPMLVKEFGEPVLILGGPGDRDAADVIARATGAINLAGRTGLQTAAALIERASYLVGVDTGLTHMGIAARRPTLCLFGSTRPYTDTATPEGRVLYHDMACAPCRRRPSCDGRFDCMRAITPEEVMTVLSALLERSE